MAVEADVFLRGYTRFRCADGKAVQNVDLRLDDVDAGDLFGHGMLDLNAWVHFDEVEFPGIGIHQIFDGAGADIVRGFGDAQRIRGQFGALFGREVRCRRALNDLLVAALDRAVAFEKVHDIAVGVAENLAFDVTRALNELFEIDFVLAEGGLGFALTFVHFPKQVVRVADGPHTATATAPGGLEHDRIADLLGQTLDFFLVVRERIGRGNDRNTDGDRQIACGHLVAQLAHGFRLRADEDDAVFGAGLGKFGAFRKKAITGVDGVCTGKFGDANDFINRKIALDRAQIAFEMRPAADLIALVCLETVKRQLVFFRPDRHGLDAEFVCSAENADCDFRTVCDENFRNRQGLPP